MPLSGGVVTWWETFEEYAVGAAGTLDKGGSKWDGAAVLVPSYVGSVEDFESYAVGVAGTLDGGEGWSGAANLVEF